jgi:hypothetical protein
MRRILAGIVLGATGLVLTGAAPAAHATDTRPTDEHPDAIEAIRLGCARAVIAVRDTTTRDPDDLRRKLVIGCRWSQSHHPRFAAYKVYRQVDHEPRHLWFATRDRDRTRVIDYRVLRGHSYTYRVVVVNHDGKIIGISNKVTVTT